MVFRGTFRNVSNIKYLKDYDCPSTWNLGFGPAPGSIRRFGLTLLKFQNTQLLGWSLAVYSDFPEFDSIAIGAVC
jgi:hypothetical protein